VVAPSGTAAAEFDLGCMGAQLVARSGDGGAVLAGGVVSPGGAWATAMLPVATHTNENRSARFIAIWEKRPARADVPQPDCRGRYDL